MKKRIDIDGYSGDLVVRFGFDEEIRDRVRILPQARWSRTDRAWFVPIEHVNVAIDALKGRGFSMAPRVRAVLDEGAKTAGEPAEGAPTTGVLTVASLNARVRHALRTSFASEVWVVGEVASLRTRRGGMFFELIDRGKDDRVAVKVSAVIFPEGGRRIERTLARAGVDVQPIDGLRICVRGRVELYEPTGTFQLVVDDIDPLHTLGHLAQRREAILHTLRDEGLAERNLRVPMAAIPLRVGLVTSEAADGYADFVEELHRSGFAFRVFHCNVRVQGELAEPSVTAALAHLSGHADALDVVAIVRGGGAKTDLAAFDSPAIARAVCLHPTPVVIGVGHQTDRCVLDDVARSFKTPTAAAASLVDAVRAGVQAISKLEVRLRQAASRGLRVGRNRLAPLAVGLRREVSHRLDLERRGTDHTRASLGAAARVATRGAERDAIAAAGRVQRAANFRLGGERRELELSRCALLARRGRVIGGRGDVVDELEGRIKTSSASNLRQERERLLSWSARTQSLDPAALLRRGFALVRQYEGRLVRRATDVAPGDLLSLQFTDASISARAISADDVDLKPYGEPTRESE